MASLGGGGYSCTVCSKTSYPAETILFETKPYHFDCFRCTKCNKKMDNAGNAAQFEGKLYCRPCFDREGFAQKQTKVKWEPKQTSARANAIAARFGGGGTPCFSCQKTVYPGEATSYDGKVFHPDCMKCTDCSKKCAPSDVGMFEDKVYCTACFQKNGYHRKQLETIKRPSETKATSVSSRFAHLGGGGAKCYICQKTVYPAETVQYDGRPYHNKCFRCSQCNKELTPADADAKGDKVWCRKCFQELGLHRADIDMRKAAQAKQEAAAAPAESAPAPEVAPSETPVEASA